MDNFIKMMGLGNTCNEKSLKGTHVDIWQQMKTFNSWFNYEDSYNYGEAPSLDELVKMYNIVQESGYSTIEGMEEGEEEGDDDVKKYLDKIYKLKKKWNYGR